MRLNTAAALGKTCDGVDKDELGIMCVWGGYPGWDWGPEKTRGNNEPSKLEIEHGFSISKDLDT